MSKEYKAYRHFYAFVNVIMKLLFRIHVQGADNIMPGRGMICANHSSFLDPFVLAVSCTGKHHLRIMGKVELFRIPVVGWFIRRIGMFPVDRGNNDVQSIRTAMKLLKSEEKVVIFPEGTRVSSDDAVAAKSGAVRLAHKMDAPIYPVFIPRKKRVFSKINVVIGEAFTIPKDGRKLDASDYALIADDLMKHISSLNPEV